MTIIPLLVPSQPPEWLLLDLQGDISLRRIAQSHGGHRLQALNPVDKPALNAIDTYANLKLGVVQTRDGQHHLRIGNHLLECQLTALRKPLLVCKRSRHVVDAGRRGQQAEGGKEGSSGSSSIHCVAVVRHKVSVLTRPAPIIVATPGPMPAIH